MGNDSERVPRGPEEMIVTDTGRDRSEILVTGGTGFLGRRIVIRLLELGREVTLFGRKHDPELARRGARFIHGALEDLNALRTACRGMEAVFHVAAKVGVWGPYEDYYRINVLATRAL